MDLKQLLGKLTLIEGSMQAAEKNPTGPKFTGQWKGTDKGTPGKKLVGDSIDYEESILKDLSKGPTPKTKEKELAEQFEAFLQALEEENLGVTDKRPLRQGARPARDYGKTGEPSKRYKQVDEHGDQEGYEPWGPQDLEPGQKAIQGKPVKDPKKFTKDLSKDLNKAFGKKETDESRGHKVVATKLKDIERAGKPSAELDLKQREAQAKADYRKYVEKMKKLNPNYVPLYKMDEAGANNPMQGTANQTIAQQDPKKVAATNQALQTMKAGTGSTAPTPMIAKALDAASQGKPVGQQDMKNLEPLMKDLTTVAQDPKLASQFKTLAQQIQQVQKKQQTT